MAEFELELANESSGHLYSRECCANTRYAIGAWHTRHARTADAVAAFDHALQRVPKHAMAQLGRAVAAGTTPPPVGSNLRPASGSMDEAVYLAAGHVLGGSRHQVGLTAPSASAATRRCSRMPSATDS